MNTIKKRFISVILVLTMALGFTLSAPVVEIKADSDPTVYITKTGSKYHTCKCGNGTYYPATLSEALWRGLEPCSKCGAASVVATPDNTSDNSKKDNTNTTNTKTTPTTNTSNKTQNDYKKTITYNTKKSLDTETFLLIDVTAKENCDITVKFVDSKGKTFKNFSLSSFLEEDDAEMFYANFNDSKSNKCKLKLKKGLNGILFYQIDKSTNCKIKITAKKDVLKLEEVLYLDDDGNIIK